MNTIFARIRDVLKAKKRVAASGFNEIVGIAAGLILFATIGFVGLQLLATAGTTSMQPVVVLISITVVSVMAALAVALFFLRHVRA